MQMILEITFLISSSSSSFYIDDSQMFSDAISIGVMQDSCTSICVSVVFMILIRQRWFFGCTRQLPISILSCASSAWIISVLFAVVASMIASHLELILIICRDIISICYLLFLKACCCNRILQDVFVGNQSIGKSSGITYMGCCIWRSSNNMIEVIFSISYFVSCKDTS